MRLFRQFRSIRTQFALTFILLMGGVIAVCLILNQTLLGPYYIREKQKTLEEVFTLLNSSSGSGQLEQEEDVDRLERALGRNNIGLILIDQSSRTIKSYSSDGAAMLKRLFDNLLGAGRTEQGGPESGEEEMTPVYGEDGTTLINLLKTSDHYIVQTVMDVRSGSRYMELWGTLEKGEFFLMRTALEDIENSAVIANRFFLLSGLAVILMGTALSLWFSGRITGPVRRLTEVSDRMKQLDFSAKYGGGGSLEVEALGRNMNELSEKLETTISELKTANNELLDDLKEKEEMEAVRREFLGNVTHELKTPIALIQGYAEGIQDGMADDKESLGEYVGVILDEASRMDRMVKSLLTLDHIESGAESVTMSRFDLSAMIRRLVQSSQLLAEKQDVKVVLDLPDELYVWADPMLTEEVFLNYFSNALHYVKEVNGEKVITVRSGQGGEKDKAVTVTVFNTGDPVPEESIPRLWEKFYKVDKARTRAYGGSGIGLSIVKAIMERMNQQYGVTNYDNGVAFYFTLDTENA